MRITINKKSYTLSLTPEDYQSLSALGGTIKSLLAYLKAKFEIQEEIVALTISNESVNLKDLTAPIQCIEALTFPLNALPSDLLSHVQRWGESDMVKSLRMVSRLMKYHVETSKVPILIFDEHFQSAETLWPLFEKRPYRTAFKQWFEGEGLIHFLKAMNETIRTWESQVLLRKLCTYLENLLSQQTPNTSEQKLLFALVLENQTDFLLLLLYSKEKNYSQERDYLKEKYPDLFENLEYIRFATSINSRFNRKKQVCNRIMKYYNGSLEEGVDKHFIYDQLKIVDGLQLDQQFIALKSMKAALDSGTILLSSKEAVVSMIQKEVEPRSVSYQRKRLEALKQERQAREQARQRADAAEQKIQHLEAALAAATAHSSGHQGFAHEGLEHTERVLAEDEEKDKVVRRVSESSMARTITRMDVSASSPYAKLSDQKPGKGLPPLNLALPSPANSSERKRFIPMHKETATASFSTKKRKTGEVPNAEQVNRSSIGSDDESTQEQQSSAPDPLKLR